MTLAEQLNTAKVRPIVKMGGKVFLYEGTPNDEKSVAIEECMGIIDLYISRHPDTDDILNLVVWAESDDGMAFFDKKIQEWMKMEK